MDRYKPEKKKMKRIERLEPALWRVCTQQSFTRISTCNIYEYLQLGLTAAEIRLCESVRNVLHRAITIIYILVLWHRIARKHLHRVPVTKIDRLSPSDTWIMYIYWYIMMFRYIRYRFLSCCSTRRCALRRHLFRADEGWGGRGRIANLTIETEKFPAVRGLYCDA